MTCDHCQQRCKNREGLQLHLSMKHRQPPEGMKWCPTCDQMKVLEDFARSRTATSGRMGPCRACSKVKRDAYYASNYRHGKKATPGPCAICGEVGRRVIDHDHSCCPEGRSCPACRRGLLCGPCNSGLGLFKDSPEALLAAVAYLSDPPGIPT